MPPPVCFKRQGNETSPANHRTQEERLRDPANTEQVAHGEKAIRKKPGLPALPDPKEKTYRWPDFYDPKEENPAANPISRYNSLSKQNAS